MLVAVLLQVVAAVGLILGAWLLSGVGGAVMAAAVVVFLVGWSLEQRHSA
jgi:hypothetical protein